MEDPGLAGNLGLHNVYNLCKAKPANPENSHPYVNELKLNSDGVWECDIHIPVQVGNQSDLKSIYRKEPKFLKSAFGAGNLNKDISTADTDFEEDEEHRPNFKRGQLNFPVGKFIPVFGHNGCHFPPDYRLFNSRAGPQFRFVVPAESRRPAPPHYYNNQFFRHNRLARWNSLERDDADTWDPFNLKYRHLNGGLGHPGTFNQHLNSRWVHGNNFGPFNRELLVYPNPNFQGAFNNQFNRYA
ncbi:hypothetical protein MACJ_001820 [Theileria orientalis]|uniref:Uncharacterized protein n=1 Tax=Theileria orientalis TaxID=68886 RepID=A0A976M509_THEOR|nr:hypothetical protein MACJ_001820 [Theileria orientalis]